MDAIAVGTVTIDVEKVIAASDIVHRAAADIRAGAGGVDRGGVPPVPEDRHGVASLFIGFDEAREKYDGQVADRLTRVAAALAAHALKATRADAPFVHLPAAGVDG